MPAKLQRLETRVTYEQKQLIERAAKLEGCSITDFVLASTQAAARQVIREHEILRLTAKDREVLVSALVNPPEPNAKLREAVWRNSPAVRR